ncbi:MAG TPA: hypothetical protein VD738_07105 [Nitrospira sp.]|nr:hypothetical protein [Nitrospira sp.]
MKRLRQLTLVATVALMTIISIHVPGALAQPGDEVVATTELSCAFAMTKGETAQECRVSFPEGCLVAHIPGTRKPWATLSKGGRVMCRFDEKRTDWKTAITGACGRCRSDHCSAKFSVRFDCSLRQ